MHNLIMPAKKEEELTKDWHSQVHLRIGQSVDFGIRKNSVKGEDEAGGTKKNQPFKAEDAHVPQSGRHKELDVFPESNEKGIGHRDHS